METGLHEVYEFAVPKRDYNGIELYFHDPHEVIGKHVTVRHVKETAVTKFSVYPKILNVDTSMADFHIHEYASLKFYLKLNVVINFSKKFLVVSVT